MDTRLLKMFSAVAKKGTLPAASRELHLSASALSHGLKALETNLGARLFDRIGRKLVLNHAGEQLLAQIEGPLGALDKAAAAIKALGRWGHGRIRIGAPEAICQHVLPQPLRELNRAFSKLFIVLDGGDTGQLLEWLRQDRIDLAFGIQPDHAPDLEIKPWFEDELLLTFSAEHPWTDGRPFSPQDLAKQPLISYSRTSLTARMIDRFFQEQDVELSALMEVKHIGAIKELVNLNVAAALMAPWVFDQELMAGQVKMRPLGAKGLKRSWSVMHLSQKRLSLVEVELIKLCQRHVAGLWRDRKDLPPAALVRPK